MSRKILALCFTLFTALLVFFLWPNDEKKIRHNLELLAEYSSSKPDDATLAILTNVRKASLLCTESCAVDIASFRGRQDFTRKNIIDHIMMMKKMLPDTRFHFNDVTINFQEENHAVISSTLSLQGETKSQRFTDAYEMDISTVKMDGDWLFSSFTAVECIEK